MVKSVPIREERVHVDKEAGGSKPADGRVVGDERGGATRIAIPTPRQEPRLPCRPVRPPAERPMQICIPSQLGSVALHAPGVLVARTQQ